jgi:hypothetical protein
MCDCMSHRADRVAVDRRRASDSERERVVSRLRDAATIGRLSLAELDERVHTAYRSRTRGELAALLDDLPAPRRATTPMRLPWFPGLSPFSASWRGAIDPRLHGANVLRFLGPVFTDCGYELVDRTSDRLVYRRTSRSMILALLFGLPGLLLGRSTATVTIDMLVEADGTLAVVQGVAPLRLRRAFARLEAELEAEWS